MASSSPVVEAGYHAGRRAPNSGRTFPPEVLTADEVKGLIRASSNRALTGIRNRALITVMYRAGLRLSEALALKPKDIDPDAGTITVLHGKGDKRRVVGLDPGSMAILLRVGGQTSPVRPDGALHTLLHASRSSPSCLLRQDTVAPSRGQGRYREESSPARSAALHELRVNDGGCACTDHPTAARAHLLGDHAEVSGSHRTQGVGGDDAEA
jgi:integrase